MKFGKAAVVFTAATSGVNANANHNHRSNAVQRGGTDTSRNSRHTLRHAPVINGIPSNIPTVHHSVKPTPGTSPNPQHNVFGTNAASATTPKTNKKQQQQEQPNSNKKNNKGWFDPKAAKYTAATTAGLVASGLGAVAVAEFTSRRRKGDGDAGDASNAPPGGKKKPEEAPHTGVMHGYVGYMGQFPDLNGLRI